SISRTLRRSSVIVTSATRSSAANAKIPIPRLQKLSLSFANNPFDLTKISSPESKVTRKAHRIQLELCRARIAINMDVSGFIGFVAEEIDSVRAFSEDSRHIPYCNSARRFSKLPK